MGAAQARGRRGAAHSWSILDKVTDTLSMHDNLGRVGAALNDQWSPRIGIWDPTPGYFVAFAGVGISGSFEATFRPTGVL